MKSRSSAFFATVHPGVFTASAILVIAFVIFGVAAPETASTTFAAIHEFITEYFGWLYLLAISGFLVFLVFLVWLALSRFGDVRLGQPEERPRFAFLTWFAMLFSAGMGIGLVFWSVAEPILHYQNPPTGEGETLSAVKVSA